MASMTDSIIRWLSQLPDKTYQLVLRQVINPIADRHSTLMLTTPGLVIKAGGGVLVKAGSAFYASVQGLLVTKAANTDMAALAGTVTNAKFNVFCFFIDSAGTLTSAMGTEGAAIGSLKFPPFPEGKALIGFIIVNPTGTGNFVGNTTALDDATVAPNVVYVNGHIGPFDPSILL